LHRRGQLGLSIGKAMAVVQAAASSQTAALRRSSVNGHEKPPNSGEFGETARSHGERSKPSGRA
jgi:hypothetical protein